MPLKKYMLPTMALLAGFLATAVYGDKPNDVGPFMRAKLLHSQKVLEGLTTNKMDLVAKNSQQIALLSQSANWRVLQTPEYLQRSIEFRRAVNEVTQAAKDDNLDGAALGYVSMTMKCIECHRYVRSVKQASLLDAPKGFTFYSTEKAGR